MGRIGQLNNLSHGAHRVPRARRSHVVAGAKNNVDHFDHVCARRHVVRPFGPPNETSYNAMALFQNLLF